MDPQPPVKPRTDQENIRKQLEKIAVGSKISYQGSEFEVKELPNQANENKYVLKGESINPKITAEQLKTALESGKATLVSPVIKPAELSMEEIKRIAREKGWEKPEGFEPIPPAAPPEPPAPVPPAPEPVRVEPAISKLKTSKESRKILEVLQNIVPGSKISYQGRTYEVKEIPSSKNNREYILTPWLEPEALTFNLTFSEMVRWLKDGAVVEPEEAPRTDIEIEQPVPKPEITPPPGPETDTFSTDFIAKRIQLLLESIKAIRKMKVIDVKGSGNEIFLNFQVEAEWGGMTSDIGIQGIVENKNDTISIKNYKIDADILVKPFVKGLVELELDKIEQRIRADIKTQTGRKVEKMEIVDGALRVTFAAETPVVSTLEPEPIPPPIQEPEVAQTEAREAPQWDKEFVREIWTEFLHPFMGELYVTYFNDWGEIAKYFGTRFDMLINSFALYEMSTPNKPHSFDGDPEIWEVLRTEVLPYLQRKIQEKYNIDAKTLAEKMGPAFDDLGFSRDLPFNIKVL